MSFKVQKLWIFPEAGRGGWTITRYWKIVRQKNNVQGPLLLKLLFVGLKTMSPSVSVKHPAHCNIHCVPFKGVIFVHITFQSDNLVTRIGQGWDPVQWVFRWTKWQTDRREWKYHIPTTLFPDSKNVVYIFHCNVNIILWREGVRIVTSHVYINGCRKVS